LSAWFHWRGEDLILDVHVQPRASKDEIAGVHGDRLKVRITTPPVDGKANRHLIAFFAELFKVAKGNVAVLSGESGRDKRIQIKSPKHLPPIFSSSAFMD
jgi:uncharacterized protein (TIGR00251 family)